MLKHSEALLRTVSKLSHDILWEWNIDTGTLNWFGNIDQQLGYQENDFPRTIEAWQNIIHPEDQVRVEKTLNKAIKQGAPWALEYRVIDNNGLIQHWIDRGEVTAEKEGQPQLMAGAITDISQRKLQHDIIIKMAHFDALTGLPNRTLLRDRFNQALAHSKRCDSLLAICFLDLDDFKPVNDNFGHDVGDTLLIEVAARLEKTVRAEDTVSRLGGDEFSMLLGDIKSINECSDMLERLIQAVSAPYLINEHDIKMSASLGVSLCPRGSMDFDILLRHADQQMYQAKQEGKNSYRIKKTTDD